MFPRNPTFLPNVKVFHNLTDDQVIRLGTLHNKENEIRQKTGMLEQKLMIVRKCFAKLVDKKWTKVEHECVMEGLGYHNPTPSLYKSQNEFFKMGSVTEKVWVLMMCMIRGEYTQYVEVKVFIICSLAVTCVCWLMQVGCISVCLCWFVLAVCSLFFVKFGCNYVI